MNNKIFWRNFAVFIVLLCLIELISFFIYLNRYSEAFSLQSLFHKKFMIQYEKPSSSLDFEKFASFFSYGKENKGKAIVIAGGSYSAGSNLEEKDTFAYKVSKLANRRVYLRAIPATGLAHIYYQVKNNLIPKDTEYIIYTFIWDHLNRLHKYQLGYWGTSLNLRYGVKNGRIYEMKNYLGFLNSLYSVKLIQEYLDEKNFAKEAESYALFTVLTDDLMRILKTTYPDTKFVILEYPQEENIDSRFPKNIKEHLEKSGCIIINANDITGVNLGKLEYKIETEKVHPNGKAWSLVVPKLIEELKL